MGCIGFKGFRAEGSKVRIQGLKGSGLRVPRV